MIDHGGAFHLEWTQLALASADLGAFAIDATTRAVRLDSRAAEMLGLAGATDLEPFLSAIDPSDRDRIARHLDTAFVSDGDAYHEEFKTTARRWISADGRTRRDGGGAVALYGVLSDVTLRHTTEDARTRLVDEMARTLRFNDMLIGVVAHDLQEQLGRQQRDPTSTPSARAARMSRIIDQMLDLTHARLDGQIPLQPRETELAALVKQSVADLVASEPDARIDVDVRADTRCSCDAERVRQIMTNLLGNAVRHGSDPRQVRVVVDGTGSRVVTIAVSNPGVIPAELTPTLFNPFRRVRADRTARDRSHGLGLGLYIARRIAIGHGGDITTATADASGTSFRVELPRMPTSSAFSLTPDRAEEEAMSMERLGLGDQQSRVTAALFGVMPIEKRAPDAFASLVDRHVRLLELSLERQIYRDARVDLATELRELAEQLGAMGAGASDVAELHSHALQRAIKGAPAVKVQALVAEGRLLALELMGRLVTFYRKRSGFGSLARGKSETAR